MCLCISGTHIILAGTHALPAPSLAQNDKMGSFSPYKGMYAVYEQIPLPANLHIYNYKVSMLRVTLILPSSQIVGLIWPGVIHRSGQENDKAAARVVSGMEIIEILSRSWSHKLLISKSLWQLRPTCLRGMDQQSDH